MPRPKASDPIPVVEVAIRATEVSNLLENLRSQYADTTEIDKIKEDISDAAPQMAIDQQRSVRVLQSQPSLERLKTETQLWQKSQSRVTKWLNQLTQRAIKLQAVLGEISDLQQRWRQTLATAKEAKAPETVIEQISAVFSALDAEFSAAQAQHRGTIYLQGWVAAEVARCDDVLTKISKARQVAAGITTHAKMLPIWSPELWAGLRNEGIGRWRELSGEQLGDFGYYVRDASRGIPVHFGVFVVTGVLFHALRRRVRQWAPEESSAAISMIAGRPLICALISTLLLASSPYSATPPTVRNLLYVLLLAAMIRLMTPAVHHRLARGFYAVWLLFTVDTVRHIIAGATLLDHILLVFEAVAGSAALGGLMAFGGLQRCFFDQKPPRWAGVFKTGTVLVLVIFGSGLVSAILGYMQIARPLVSGVLICSVQALTLFAGAKILFGIISFGFRVRPLRLLRAICNHRSVFERGAYNLLMWGVTGAWSIRVLDYLGMLQPAFALGKRVLALRLERGTFGISLADVFAFAVTVWVAYLGSRLVRFVLQEDVYPRKMLPPGVAYAASKLIHYFILTIGFVVGLGMLGMDLTKVTVLISAFGLGIGFGLQSIVNNFVSGLILLFERPIHLGDTIEMGNFRGEVRQMGMRSTIVRTRQGAEIIVPNSNLVSEQLTNWTFSDQTRRIELPVGINYGALPQKVIEVLESVADAHPNILKDPRPQALLIGFGDSSVNFELRAWIDSVFDWAQVKSELAVDVYAAVHSAGFSFPFPQREVRLRDSGEM